MVDEHLPQVKAGAVLSHRSMNSTTDELSVFSLLKNMSAPYCKVLPGTPTPTCVMAWPEANLIW